MPRTRNLTISNFNIYTKRKGNTKNMDSIIKLFKESNTLTLRLSSVVLNANIVIINEMSIHLDICQQEILCE